MPTMTVVVQYNQAGNGKLDFEGLLVLEDGKIKPIQPPEAAVDTNNSPKSNQGANDPDRPANASGGNPKIPPKGDNKQWVMPS